MSGSSDAATGEQPISVAPPRRAPGVSVPFGATMASALIDRRATRFDLALLGAATLLLRLPAYVADRHLTFDDGVYGASAVAMRAGGVPFRDVFSSQGPLFLPLVWLADLVGGRSADAPRVLSLVAALVLVGATYWAGRAITDRGGALLAAGLVTTSGSVLWVTGPIASDGIAIAFATVTVLLALRWRDDVTLLRAVGLGLGVGATVSVKALLAPAIIPVALVLLAGRRVVPILVAAGTSLAFHFSLWLPFGPAEVWEQAFAYHLEVAGDRTPGRNLGKILSTAGDRDALVVAAVVALLGGLALRRTHADVEPLRTLRSPDLLLLSWLAGTVVVLLVEHPLWRPHVSQLIPVLTLLAARHRPPAAALVVAAVLVVPYHLVHAWPILHPSGYRADTQAAIDILRGLPAGALAISDDPGVVWRAGRRTPPDLVDASILRLQSGNLDSAGIAEAAADPAVCAVVVRSTVRWGSLADLPDRLARAGYELVRDEGPGDRVYVDPAC